MLVLESFGDLDDMLWCPFVVYLQLHGVLFKSFGRYCSYACLLFCNVLWCHFVSFAVELLSFDFLLYWVLVYIEPLCLAPRFIYIYIYISTAHIYTYIYIPPWEIYIYIYLGPLYIEPLFMRARYIATLYKEPNI